MFWFFTHKHNANKAEPTINLKYKREQKYMLMSLIWWGKNKMQNLNKLRFFLPLEQVLESEHILYTKHSNKENTKL